MIEKYQENGFNIKCWRHLLLLLFLKLLFLNSVWLKYALTLVQDKRMKFT